MPLTAVHAMPVHTARCSLMNLPERSGCLCAPCQLSNRVMRMDIVARVVLHMRNVFPLPIAGLCCTCAVVFKQQGSLQVGKAWLYLSKAYQNYGAGGDAGDAKDKSEAALFRYMPDHVPRSLFEASPGRGCSRSAAPKARLVIPFAENRSARSWRDTKGLSLLLHKDCRRAWLAAQRIASAAQILSVHASLLIALHGLL